MWFDYFLLQQPYGLVQALPFYVTGFHYSNISLSAFCLFMFFFGCFRCKLFYYILFKITILYVVNIGILI